jgi:hypothetical protein
MEVSLKQIILYARDPQVTAKFLTALLDFEDYQLDSPKGKGIVIDSKGWSFFILKAKAEHLLALEESRDMEVNFSVSSREVLDDLLHKLQFYQYRSEEHKSHEPPKMIKDDDHIYFKAIDPDGRRWVFSYYQ